MYYSKPSASRLLELMDQQIVILDGAMGTMIQQHNFTEEDSGRADYIGGFSVTTGDEVEQLAECFEEKLDD